MSIAKQICRSFKQNFMLSAVVLGGLGVSASFCFETKAAAASSQFGVTIDLVELEKAGKFSSLSKVKVNLKDDPAYNRPITLEGYRLEDILKFLPGLEQKKDGRHEIRFIATDGYEVSAPLQNLFEGKVYWFSGNKSVA